MLCVNGSTMILLNHHRSMRSISSNTINRKKIIRKTHRRQQNHHQQQQQQQQHHLKKQSYYAIQSSSSTDAFVAVTYTKNELCGIKEDTEEVKKTLHNSSSSSTGDVHNDDNNNSDNGENNNSNNNNNNSNNGFNGGSGGFGGNRDDNDNDNDNALSITKVEQLCDANKVQLPNDMLTMIRTSNGLKTVVLMRWIDLATSKSFFAKYCVAKFSFFRNRALMDSSFTRRLLSDITIDLVLLSLIEFIRVRPNSSISMSKSSSSSSRKTTNHRFLDEWEFFVCDILASVGMNAAICSLVAPAVRTRGSIGGLNAFTATRKRGRAVAFLSVSSQIGASAFAIGFLAQALAEGMYSARIMKTLTSNVVVVSNTDDYDGTKNGTNNKQSSSSSLKKRKNKNVHEAVLSSTSTNNSRNNNNNNNRTETAFRIGKQFGIFAATSSSSRQHAVLAFERFLERKVARVAMVSAASVSIRVANAIYGSREFQKQQREEQKETFNI
jgi:hypothetical protein